MMNGSSPGWCSAPLDDADAAAGIYRNYRGVSCGSTASFHDAPCSQLSARFSSRISCRSSVRDEEQTFNEFLRKQRVVRYMQEERERGARSRLEREEHDDWMNFRSSERAERIKYLNEKEISELLRREAEEAERERLEAEEALRRSAEAAMERRRRMANERRKKIDVGAVQNETDTGENVPLRLRAANEQVAKTETVDETTKMKEIAEKPRRCEDDLPLKLRMAQEDAASLKKKQEETTRALRQAEENVLLEAKRADREANARKKAEKNVSILEGKLEDMRKSFVATEEKLRMAKKDENSTATTARENAKLLNHLREQLRAAEQEKKDMEAKCVHLQMENAGLTKKMKYIRTNMKTAEKAPQKGIASTRATKGDLHTKAAHGNSDNMYQPHQTDADQKRLKELEDALDLMHSRLDLQASALNRTAAQLEEARERLWEETAVRRKFEVLATQSIESRADGPTRVELEAAERKAKKYMEEADAAQARLNELRTSSDKEITYLKEWCARLENQCSQQMKELREQMSCSDLYSPTTARDLEVNDRQRFPELAAKRCNPDDAATIEELRSELLALQAKLEEAEEMNRQAVARAQCLKQENEHYQKQIMNNQSGSSGSEINDVTPPAGASPPVQKPSDPKDRREIVHEGRKGEGREAHGDDVGVNATKKNTLTDEMLETYRGKKPTSGGNKNKATHGCC